MNLPNWEDDEKRVKFRLNETPEKELSGVLSIYDEVFDGETEWPLFKIIEENGKEHYVASDVLIWEKVT